MAPGTRMTRGSVAIAEDVASLTARERLLFAQAVYEHGSKAWPEVSKLLSKHPLIKRPKNFFTAQACIVIYNELMAQASIERSAEDEKPRSKVNLTLAQRHYHSRMVEIKAQIAKEEERFRTLVTEVDDIRRGRWDQSIIAGINAQTTQPQVPKLFPPPPHTTPTPTPPAASAEVSAEPAPSVTEEVPTSAVEEVSFVQDDANEPPQEPEFVPEVDEMQAQEPAMEELDHDQTEEREQMEVENVTSVDDEVQNEHESPMVVPEQEQEEGEREPQAPEEEVIQSQEEEEEGIEDVEVNDVDANDVEVNDVEVDDVEVNDVEVNDVEVNDVEMKDATPTRIPVAESAGLVSEEASQEDVEEGVSETVPASPSREATPPPKEEDVRANGSMEEGEQVAEEPDEEGPTVPPSTEETSEVVVDDDEDIASNKEEDVPPEEAEKEVKVVKEVVSEEVEAEVEGENESGDDVEDGDDEDGGDDEDVGDDEEDGEGAEVVDVEETVKEEEIEEEAPVLRRSRRLSRAGEETKEVAKSTKKGKTKEPEPEPEGAEAVEEEMEVINGENEDADQKEENEEEEEGPAEAVTESNETSQVSTPAPVTSKREQKRKASEVDDKEAAPDAKRVREESEAADDADSPAPDSKSAKAAQKRFQTLISLLHSQISQHRNGAIFHNPIKPSEAPDYHDIVKRPMDLKTIKMRVKDGTITNSLEFQRDIYLMFGNAMMYNRPGSSIYGMAEEMMLESEAQIQAFRQTEGFARQRF